MKNPILFFLFLIPYTLPAQKVSIVNDRDSVLIGEQIKVEITAEFIKGQSYSWSVPDTIAHFEILDASKLDSSEEGNTVIIKQNLTITSWDSGSWNFPAIPIGPFQTTPFKVEVGYTAMDPNQDYHDIKDIIPVVETPASKWYWYFILFIIIIALFLLFFPPAKLETKPDFVPDQNAYQKAIHQLEVLENEQGKEDRIYFTELVNILRNYLLKSRNIYSHSKTSDDLAIQIGNLHLDKDKYTGLLQTLRLSDLVKYAKFKANQDEKGKAIHTVKDTITTIENSNAV